MTVEKNRKAVRINRGTFFIIIIYISKLNINLKNSTWTAIKKQKYSIILFVYTYNIITNTKNTYNLFSKINISSEK